ncbi:glycosyltransferase [Streptomyces sp. NRRL F-5126]|uniref:glycosyltransferase n=1 Tax=Streptomyces sp. NRRL F-5126 TaxID=1463857 RepID=UPI0004CBA31F|nr:glycosyltransferase [Streptomyces sp. NRRL F-5126]
MNRHKRTPSPPRHIAMVSVHASPLAALGDPGAGGQNVYVAGLAGRLARRGHRVTVYTRRADPGLPPHVRTADGYLVVHVPAGPATYVPRDELLGHMPAFGEFLTRSWSLETPDAAHAHFWMSGMAALAGARQHGVPVVQSYHALGTVARRHQGDEEIGPHERLAVERAIGREAAHVVATCTDEVAELREMGVPRRRISVVPCGVDTDRFTPMPGTRRPQGAPQRLLAVGRLVRRKGFDRAIHALADVPDAELLIAGGPEASLLFADPEAERLRKTAEECGVSERVKLLGAISREEMPHLMSGADLVLSLPQYEPFGIVAIEAMACGKPVLVTAVGGHLDTVVSGVTGALVPTSAGHDLADTIRKLLDDPRRLERLGASGRERVLDRYTWDRVTDGVSRVYNRLSRAPSPVGSPR